jgi:tripartite-type tricarboxylate transporter receptor subunit TctC
VQAACWHCSNCNATVATLITWAPSTPAASGQVAGVLKADMRDYVPVAMMVEETTLVAVRADSPLKTAADLVAAAQARPRQPENRRGARCGPEHAPGHCQAAEGGRRGHRPS